MNAAAPSSMNPESTPPPAADRFTAHFQQFVAPVEGWLSEEEARLLYEHARAARGGLIVEVGAYRGRSTTALVLGSIDGAGLPVYSVDPHADFVGTMGGHYGPADRQAFYRNALTTGIWRLSRLVNLRSTEAARAIDGPIALLWIDGDHGTQAVMQDVRAWAPKLAADGVLILDDMTGPAPGPRLACEALQREGWQLDGPAVGKVALLRPPRRDGEGGPVSTAAAGGVTRRAAAELVRASRFDLGAKHLYARWRALGADTGWGREVYLAHLRLWNGYFEDVPRKTQAQDFVSAFDAILDATAASAPDDGLDTVLPVTLDGAPLNGSHRIAAALLHGRPVRTMALEVQLDKVLYDGAFFEGLAQRAHHDDDAAVLAAMALEFARIAPDCRVVTLFPAAAGDTARVDELLRQHAHIVWERRCSLADDTLRCALVRLLYEGEAWVGTPADGFHGAPYKARECFAAGSELRFVLVQPRPQGDLRVLKAQLREVYGIGNHSVHINDTAEETQRILQTATDPEALQLYALAEPRPWPTFGRLFEALRAHLARNGRAEQVVVGGSALLALLGLRDCADLDYVHHGAPLEDTEPLGIASHNAYAQHFPAALGDIVFDPRLHFVYRGIKFMRPGVLAAFKRSRGEAKDAADLALLAQLPLPATAPPDEWAQQPVLLIVDGGGGQALQLARLLSLRGDAARVGVAGPGALTVLAGWDEATTCVPATLATAFLPPGSRHEAGWSLARRLRARPAARLLVIEDGLPAEAAVLQVGRHLLAAQYLAMPWAQIDGFRTEFLQGLQGFAWLSDDPAWRADALAQWDDTTG